MIEFTDRYKALGIPYPDSKTICKGQCEGTGMYPTQREGEDIQRWEKVHKQNCSLAGRIAWIARNLFKPQYTDDKILSRIKWIFRKCDGYHFVKCPDCQGSGSNLLPVLDCVQDVAR